VDDLRPQILGYNISDPAHVPTPNLDKLIRNSAVFTKAYVQQAVCSPSRNSFTTGRRPQHTKVWNFKSDFRRTNASWYTVPQWFKDKLGYLVNGNGKYFHPGHPANDDYPTSWSTPSEGGWEYEDPDHQIKVCNKGTHKPLSCVVPEEDTVDKYLANLTQTRLMQLKARNRPFFLVVGHLKPHPFWGLPQSAFDLFPVQDVPLPQTNMTFVENMFNDFEPAYYSCTSINGRSEVGGAGLHVWPYTPLPHAVIRKIRQGYFAGVAHTDKMIGLTLDKLQELELMNNTIIVLHGDHGWELGERGSYCKMGVDELRTRVPLIIRDPSRPQSWGTVHTHPTEILNVFPTLVELATGTPLDYDVDGVSLAAALETPGKMVNPKGFKEPLAFSVYPRCLNEPMEISPYGIKVSSNACVGTASSNFSHMGLAVRSQDYRYIEWRMWDGAKLKPRFDISPVQIELYDHRGDDGTSFDNNFEHHNYAGEHGYVEVTAAHAQFVKQMWDSDTSALIV